VSLTKKDIELIQSLLEGSQFDRLSLEIDGLKLDLARSGSAPRKTALAPMPSANPQPVAIDTPARTEGTPAEGLVEVRSPLLGVFYRAPKPGEPPFVEVGSRVQEDSIIGIIEVMKLMNSARAGVAGEVIEIRVVNGDMVEHGEVLMLVRPE
jgi:acetyl-CoA carboxylase biotin carboxyl carrier protein